MRAVWRAGRARGRAHHGHDVAVGQRDHPRCGDSRRRRGPLDGSIGAPRHHRVGGRNSFGLRAEWLSKTWEDGLDLFADCILAPRFDGDEVDRQRRMLLDDLAARADSGSHQAFRLFAETLYPDHPYRFDVLGTVDAVGAVTRKKLARFYRDRFPVSGMTLAIVGDVDPDAVLDRLRARFGDVDAREVDEPRSPPPRSRAARRRARGLSLPAARAGPRVVGFPGTTVTSKDRFAVEVMTTILGGQSAGCRELRDKQSLAYRVSAFGSTIDPATSRSTCRAAPTRSTPRSPRSAPRSIASSRRRHRRRGRARGAS